MNTVRTMSCTSADIACETMVEFMGITISVYISEASVYVANAYLSAMGFCLSVSILVYTFSGITMSRRCLLIEHTALIQFILGSLAQILGYRIAYLLGREMARLTLFSVQ